jgi:hypothetical protein
MRMVTITIITLAGILATLITGMVAVTITTSIMGAMPLSDNSNAVVVYDFLFALVENAKIIWIMIIGAIIGLIIWWVASSQQREVVTGVYG